VLSEREITGRIAGLLRKGAVEEVAPEAGNEDQKRAPSEQPAPKAQGGQIELGKLSKKQLIELARSRQIEVSPKASKIELIAAIEAKI
jgi:hypothetical protein